ncbi:MAG: HEAT repeat domain-containing protein [Candidatus Margulisiibacteriota bacterium]
MDHSLPVLFDRLRKEETRWDAILELKMMHFPGIAKALVHSLRDPDWVVRWAVAEKLGDLQDPIALEGLCGLLADPDVHVKQNAVKSILKFGLAAVPALVAQFANVDPKVRKEVLALLLSLGDECIYDLERVLKKQDWVVGNRIVDTIWRLGGEKAEDALIRALSFKPVQKNVIMMLGMMNSKKSIPHLIHLFEHSGLRRLILYTLARLGEDEVAPQLIKALSHPDQALMAKALIVKMGTPMLPFLLKALTKKSSLRPTLLGLIERIGPQKAMPILHKLAQKDSEIKDLTKALRKKYPDKEAQDPLSSLLGIFK